MHIDETFKAIWFGNDIKSGDHTMLTHLAIDYIFRPADEIHSISGSLTVQLSLQMPVIGTLTDSPKAIRARVYMPGNMSIFSEKSILTLFPSPTSIWRRDLSEQVGTIESERLDQPMDQPLLDRRGNETSDEKQWQDYG